MPYRVIIAEGGDTESPNGTYVVDFASNRIPPGDRVGDGFSLRSLVCAHMLRDDIARLFPSVRYDVVGQWNARDWDAIAARYGAPPAPIVADDEDEEEEDDVIECATCGREGHDEDGDAWHPYYSCEDCGWSCEVRECEECLHYSENYGGSLCDSCYEEHEHPGGRSPGLSLTRCATCDSYDVHHDDVSEVFVCDHKARLLIEQRRPVTLAHPLPVLEAVA